MAGINDKSGCLSCRVLSSTMSFGIGSYLVYESRKMAGWGRHTMSMIGIAFGAIGCARLLDYQPPFLAEEQDTKDP